MRMLYFLAWAAALPFLFLYLVWQARRQPEYLWHWSERLGWCPVWTGTRRILVHAVSVGETRAAAPLILALREHYPEHEILLTHMTPTGRATGLALFGTAVRQSYFPYDFPILPWLFLRRARPEVCIFMETEIWPAFLQTCQARGIPTFLVNARLSEKSARGYRHIRRLVAPALAAFTGIAAQTSQDAARLEELGGKRPRITGNLKFDVSPPSTTEHVAGEMRRRYRGRFVFLAASTREGEESLLLDVFSRLGATDVLLVLVPRHPQRFAEVGRMIAARGFAWSKRSDIGTSAGDIQVFLGDSMGEMAAYYSAADLAYVGGSLLPFGGQNLIEAAAAGCPALIGPHTWNFEETSQQAIAEGCAIRVMDSDSLLEAIRELRDDNVRRTAMASAGYRFAASNRGATQRIMEMIEPALRE